MSSRPQLMIVSKKYAQQLYDEKYTSMYVEETSDKFHQWVLIRGALIHGVGNIKINQDPKLKRRILRLIDDINYYIFCRKTQDFKDQKHRNYLNQILEKEILTKKLT